MKEKLTVKIMDRYLRKEGVLGDNDHLDTFIILLNHEDEKPKEILIDWTRFPTEEEIEKGWKEYDETYHGDDKISKEEYCEWLEDRLTIATYCDLISPAASAYLLGNYNVSHLVDNPKWSAVDKLK
jgi:hypothetical protein